ncbi:MAG: hypothetical protein WC906_03470 [Parcubacteria group bacterium]|jgi:MinD-like ATPase involved in chromosome partitioning or flagellar assembly
MEEATSALKGADFVLVSTPESSPIEQMMELEKLINSIGGNVVSYAINNFRNEEHEKRQVERLRPYAKIFDRPIVVIGHDRNICDSESGNRKESLLEAGAGLNILK